VLTCIYVGCSDHFPFSVTLWAIILHAISMLNVHIFDGVEPVSSMTISNITGN